MLIFKIGLLPGVVQRLQVSVELRQLISALHEARGVRLYEHTNRRSARPDLEITGALMQNVQDAWIRAWHFAARAHREQMLPGHDLPYIVHIGAVAMEILVAHQQSAFERPNVAVQCALLHDILEDTTTSEAELIAAFGPEVVAGVRALTKDHSLPKQESMSDSLRRIQLQPREIWSVKLADRITNLAIPPSHWSADKVAAYRDEALVILNTLKSAHVDLATRLADRIAHYPPAPSQRSLQSTADIVK